MKTLITVFLFAASLFSIYGQTDNLKGSFLIGGSASFDFSKIQINDGNNKYDHNFIELGFEPTIAYFISNKISAGVSISSYQYFIREIESVSVDVNYSEMYLSGFIRYYPVSKFFFNITLDNVFEIENKLNFAFIFYVYHK